MGSYNDTSCPDEKAVMAFLSNKHNSVSPSLHNPNSSSKPFPTQQKSSLSLSPRGFRNPLFLAMSLFLLHPQNTAAQETVKGGYWFPTIDFPASNINSPLFTHLFCAFADLDPQSNQVTISSQDSQSFSTFTQTVQQNNPNVKTLLSIGGGGEESTPSTVFAAMASQPGSRKSFIDSSIQLARSNGFHGLDLDWEYPQTTTDMANLGTLLTEWRAAVDLESMSTGQSKLLLTAAVGFSSVHESNNEANRYPVESIRDSLDWANVMAYDFKGPSWSSSSTGAPAGLYEPGSRFSGSSGVEKWTGDGLSAAKIVLGLPFYGRAWQLVDPASHGIGAPASGVALATAITDRRGGAMDYSKIKEFISSNGAVTEYDSTRVTDYCYAGNTWIGYDDVRSVTDKVSYAKGKGLHGHFVWSVKGDGNWVLSQTASNAWKQ